MRNLNYKNLTFYNKMREIVVDVYRISKKFPIDEQGFKGIVSQMKRASISSISNMAEGSSRKEKEMLHFLALSLGSLREVDSQIEISHDLGFVNNSDYEELSEKLDESIAKLCAYMKKINENLKENK
jgi:four helix bundle protein